ncbi:YceK/YidQ family lipoprotein [uncultured Microbulbifer sp.]|uniref:YceK/YidQ family lipoprotein n=1 Tax=uncultured Microbulbifer sp. TaxID=348147 RepID=UPI00344B9C8F
MDAENNQVDVSRRGYKYLCEEIPRIYSGACYNFCLMNNEPSRMVNTEAMINDVPLMAVDTVFPVAADTIVLPYAIFAREKKAISQ